MNKLCKKCGWHCKVVLYDGNVIMRSNQCFIRIDAGSDCDPIIEDENGEYCDYFEPRKYSRSKKRLLAEFAEYVREKHKKENNDPDRR